jgi:protein tyrosine/serine phosphatase
MGNSMAEPPQNISRHLEWKGCYNVRDLGGLPTSDGGQIRGKAIVRADLLGRLTPAGKQQLLAYGIRTIIDLRSRREVGEKPSAVFSDQIEAPAYLNLWQGKKDPAFSERLRQAQTRAELYNLILDHDQAGVAEVLRAIANAQAGGVVIHCHSGKDRTGIISAVLLSLLGVTAKDAAEDYALSQARLWPLYEEILAEAGNEIKADPWLNPTVTPETILAMLSHIQQVYGGVQDYLDRGGFTAEDVALLKQRLVYRSA